MFNLLAVIDGVAFIFSLYLLRSVKLDFGEEKSVGALLLPLMVAFIVFVGIFAFGNLGLALLSLLLVLISFYYSASPQRLLSFFKTIPPGLLLFFALLVNTIGSVFFELLKGNALHFPFFVLAVIFLVSVYFMVLSTGILVAFGSLILENKGYNKYWAVILVVLDFIGLVAILLLKDKKT